MNERIAELEQRIKERADEYGRAEYLRGVEAGLAKAAGLLRIPLADLERYPDMPAEHSENGHRPPTEIIEPNRRRTRAAEKPALSELIAAFERYFADPRSIVKTNEELGWPLNRLHRIFGGRTFGEMTGLESQNRVHTAERLQQALDYMKSLESQDEPPAELAEFPRISRPGTPEPLPEDYDSVAAEITPEIADSVYEPEVCRADVPLSELAGVGIIG